jgi:hypothetical protein
MLGVMGDIQWMAPLSKTPLKNNKRCLNLKIPASNFDRLCSFHVLLVSPRPRSL